MIRRTSAKRVSRRPLKNRKFMQTLSTETFAALQAISRERGISLQELIRAQVIPDWLRLHRSEAE